MAKLVEKAYGDALFDLSVDSSRVDELFEEAKAVKTVLVENKELMNLLTHPKVDKEEKEKVVENIFKDRISADMTGFMLLTIKKDRQKFLIRILDYYIDRVKEYKRIGVATVTTAYEMDEEKKGAVERKLIATTPYDSFEITYIVDESLIGGMIIRVGDKVIDSSLKSQIETMSRELYKIRLERW
ncbi:MAG: ATP synthase F1 subunit delta [Lachnospiraceae bacterium]